MARPRRSLAAMGFGLDYRLTGITLLLRALDAVQVRWVLVSPGIVLLSGLAVLLSGISGASPTGSPRTGGPGRDCTDR